MNYVCERCSGYQEKVTRNSKDIQVLFNKVDKLETSKSEIDKKLGIAMIRISGIMGGAGFLAALAVKFFVP